MVYILLDLISIKSTKLLNLNMSIAWARQSPHVNDVACQTSSQINVLYFTVWQIPLTISASFQNYVINIALATVFTNYISQVVESAHNYRSFYKLCIE